MERWEILDKKYINLYLEEDGTFSPNNSREVFKLANHFGTIIVLVTGRLNTEGGTQTEVRCRRRPGRQRCEGKIIAFN